MDTIIFIRKRRGIEEPRTEAVGMRSHLLLRVTLDVGAEEWFGIKLVQEAKPSDPAARRGEEVRHEGQPDVRPKKRFRPLQALRRLCGKSPTRKERREAEERERQRLWEEGQERLRKVESAIGKLTKEIQELAGTAENCFCVYEDNVKKALLGKAAEGGQDGGKEILPALWRQYFQVEEFHDYFGQLWVEELLPKAILPHFMILGAAPCLPALIEKYAHKMKSLRWILPEAECSQELMDFVEDFYTEYGLAVALQPMPPDQRRIQAACEEPCNILDFTRETQIAVWDIAKGSIWLDMLSMEEKRRRIVARCTGILYYSLKEKWNQAQKKAPYVPPQAAEDKFPYRGE